MSLRTMIFAFFDFSKALGEILIHTETKSSNLRQNTSAVVVAETGQLER
jgi:hypothetical protein